MTTIIAAPKLSLVPKDSTPPTLDAEAKAAALCPLCGEKLRFQNCKGLCRSALCVFRIVLTCSDV
jgi:hypothetical protein